MTVLANTVTAIEPDDRERTLAERQIELVVTLADLCARPPRWHGERHQLGDIACAFFLISAANLAWVEAAAAHPHVRAVPVSIEAMGSFAAIEASIATGRLQLVISGSGPGTLGHLWAIAAARAQGASVLVLVPRTPPELAGSNDIQEASYDQPLHVVGACLYDKVIAMEDVAQMPRIARTLRQLFARPQGVVVQLSVPTNLLAAPCPALPRLDAVRIELPSPSAAAIARVAERLSAPGGRPAFLFGSGAVAFRDRLGALVERWGAVHLSTPAAAAILPGSLGVVGNAASGDIARRLRELEVSCLVVLGSRLAIASGGGDDALLPAGCHVVHVDADPDVIAGNAVATWGHGVTFIPSDIGEFLDALQLVAPKPQIHAVQPPQKGPS
jgi:thiamine pyrophosphate-dependent acetolactate synthase large subunit-like protein